LNILLALYFKSLHGNPVPRMRRAKGTQHLPGTWVGSTAQLLQQSLKRFPGSRHYPFEAGL
jgi:hypothetical protein